MDPMYNITACVYTGGNIDMGKGHIAGMVKWDGIGCTSGGLGLGRCKAISSLRNRKGQSMDFVQAGGRCEGGRVRKISSSGFSPPSETENEVSKPRGSDFGSLETEENVGHAPLDLAT